jgi:hypothetical protein
MSTALLDAIALATGARHRNPAEVKGGAVDGAGHVAWIETDVALLRIAGRGRILVKRKLNRRDETNWGYEGCSVPYLQWWGDRVVAISHEERAAAVWSISLGGACDVRPIPGPWVVGGDVVVWVSQDYPGLLCARALAGLRSQTPLPLRGVSASVKLTYEGGDVRVWTLGWENSEEIERVRLPPAEKRAQPTDPQAFLDRVEREISADGTADPSARMLVEAAAAPFCEDDGERPWRPAPVWLPVYWYRHLVAQRLSADAERHLACLDSIAAPLGADDQERGWEAAWSADELALAVAVRYVRRQARVQAGVCRTGELPPGWSCLLFMPAPNSTVPGSRVDPATLTPALRRAFEILAPTGPVPIPHRY